ncbi:MAG: PqqD family protein [Gemmatimonadota bacterium]
MSIAYNPSIAWQRADGVIECVAEDEASLLVRDTWESVALDEVTHIVWDFLRTPQTIEELVAWLVLEFDVTPEQCRSDLEPAMASLRQAGALVGLPLHRSAVVGNAAVSADEQEVSCWSR